MYVCLHVCVHVHSTTVLMQTAMYRDEKMSRCNYITDLAFILKAGKEFCDYVENILLN